MTTYEEIGLTYEETNYTYDGTHRAAFSGDSSGDDPLVHAGPTIDLQEAQILTDIDQARPPR